MPELLITGLGPAGLDLLSSQVLAVLTGPSRLILRTARHPAADQLQDQGVSFTTLDPEYAAEVNFERLYPRLAAAVRRQAEQADVVYAVPGHPLMGEASVRELLVQPGANVAVRVLPAPGFVDVLGPALVRAGEIPDLTEWQVIDASGLMVPTPAASSASVTFSGLWTDYSRPILIYQLDDPRIASRVKLALMVDYPDDHTVAIVRSAGDPQRESVIRLPLYQLDRSEAGTYDHLTTLYVPPLQSELRRPGYREFVEVIVRLRAPGGCPWDREQDYRSLKRFVLEEACEVVEAVESEDPDRICDELGDLMLQVLLYSQIASELGDFDLRDVIARHVEKLVRRHPHVFGDVVVRDSDNVRANWDAIKRSEKPERESLLDGVPSSLPALMKALEVSKRVARVGFEWPSLDAVLVKLDEELAELRRELPAPGSQVEGDADRLCAELGDILFTLVNLARWLKVDPEEALRLMVARFTHRFRTMEALAAGESRPLDGRSIEELDVLWERAKAAET